MFITKKTRKSSKNKITIPLALCHSDAKIIAFSIVENIEV